MASNAALREYYIDQIHEHGYTPFALPLSQTDTDSFFDAFANLRSEIFDEKTPHGEDLLNAFASTVPGRETDSKGFIEQRRIGQVSLYEIGRHPSTENKDQVHFTPQTVAHAREYMRTRGGVSIALNTMLEVCTDIQEIAKTSIRPVAAALGVEDIIFAPKGMQDKDIHILRGIDYIGCDEMPAPTRLDSLAELHFDRSKFTAALKEDRRGLVGTPGNNHVGNPNLSVYDLDAMAAQALANPISHRRGEGKFFAGAGYNHMPTDLRETSGNLSPLLHGVIDLEPGRRRRAIVYFLNQHALIKNWLTAAPSETGYTSIREYLANPDARIINVA